MNQFGIQMIGAREPFYVCMPFETLKEFRDWLLGEPLREVSIVGLSGTALINHLGISTVSGPNNPAAVELFKR